MAAAQTEGKLVFAIIYDETNPTMSQLSSSLGFFMQYRTTKKLVDDYFVPVVMKASSEQARRLVPKDDPLENCRWVVLNIRGDVLRSEGVYANPDEGLKRVREVVALADIKKTVPPVAATGQPSTQPSSHRTPKEHGQEEQPMLLAVPPAILKQYEDPNVGFVKLLPRGKYDHQLTINGGGAYFSFFHRTHEYGYGSDIALDSDTISSGFVVCDVGFFLPLKNIPLSELVHVTPEPPAWLDESQYGAWRYMWSYVKPTTEIEIGNEQRAFSRGRSLDGAKLTDRLRVVLNGTFILRSVDCDRSDVLVAAKIVQLGDDGSVVLGWRLLR